MCLALILVSKRSIMLGDLPWNLQLTLFRHFVHAQVAGHCTAQARAAPWSTCLMLLTLASTLARSKQRRTPSSRHGRSFSSSALFANFFVCDPVSSTDCLTSASCQQQFFRHLPGTFTSGSTVLAISRRRQGSWTRQIRLCSLLLAKSVTRQRLRTTRAGLPCLTR